MWEKIGGPSREGTLFFPHARRARRVTSVVGGARGGGSSGRYNIRSNNVAESLKPIGAGA
jgi:hypothetical protein